jgi:diguanylate cyclase (GGDEF)-like protein/PAS domain S-box-containing protein
MVYSCEPHAIPHCMSLLSAPPTGESYFRALFEAGGEAFIVTNERGQVIDCNSAALDQFACQRSDILGTTPPDWAPELQYNGRRSDEWAAEIFARAAKGETVAFEWTNRRLDGEFFFVDATVRRAVIDGQACYMVVSRDITERKRAEDALRTSERRFSQLIQNSYDTIVILDAAGVQRYVSPSAERVHGYSPAELVDIPVIERMIHPDDRAKVEEAFRRIIEAGAGGVQYRHRRRAGGWVHLESYGTNQLANPDIRGVVINVRDITLLKNAESMYRALFDEMLNGFAAHEIICNAEGKPIDYRFLSVNPAFERMTGLKAGNVVGHTVLELMPGTESHWIDIYGQVALSGEPAHFENYSAELDKHFEVIAYQSAPGQFACMFQDITERKRAERKINKLAFYDQLTGLPNRVLLMDRLALAVASAARSNTYGALVFIDLDNFKMLNDTRGHEAGDLLLIQVAERLRSNVRAEDTAVRQGGDEFVVLLSSLGNTEADAAQMVEGHASKLLTELNRPYKIGGLTHHTTASIGVTLFNGRSASVDELMKQADLAMYRAKAAGRNAVRFFDPAIGAAVKARADLETDLRRAVTERQFVLHYQAQVQGETFVTGAEVLVRWQHPQRGMVSPADFIPLAEETDLILPLGLWVLETACERLAAWSKNHRLSSLSIAVNVSAKQFLQPDFVDQVFSVVKKFGADPRRLKLELTESLLLQDVEKIIEKMHRLKKFGIGFSLDDFGTGYSSLSYLKRLPLDQLKIDQSFVRDVLSDPNDAAIAKTIVALGKTLGLEVIAEGVETRAQMDFLASIGCHAYQGFLLSRPVPVAEFEQQLRMP